MVWSREEEPQPLSVILPRFYLGAESDVTQDRLASLGISYVLSVSRCSPQPSFLPRSRFLRIPIDDSLRDDLLPWIPGALHFIDAAMSSGASVLVHCAAGISRSPALAVAYIMYRLDLDLDQAYRFVKECRPSISPNFNFLGQLQYFQNTLNQRSAGNEDCFTMLEDKRPFLNPRVNSSNSQEATGASSRCLGLAQQRFSDEPRNPCNIAEPTVKPARLQLPSGSASLLEKRKSLTLSFVPLATHPPTSAVHPTPEAAPAHSRGAMGKTEAETRSNGAPFRLARDLQGVSQVERGLLSPLNVTLNKLLDWGGRVMLGGMFMPPVRMGQPVLPYKC